MENTNSRKTRYTTLKILLKNKGIEYPEASASIGMSLPSFAAKITGRANKDFTVDELLRLSESLDLDKTFIFDAVSGRWN